MLLTFIMLSNNNIRNMNLSTFGRHRKLRGCCYSPELLVSHRLCPFVKRRKTSGEQRGSQFCSLWQIREIGQRSLPTGFV